MTRTADAAFSAEVMLSWNCARGGDRASAAGAKTLNCDDCKASDSMNEEGEEGEEGEEAEEAEEAEEGEMGKGKKKRHRRRYSHIRCAAGATISTS